MKEINSKEPLFLHPVYKDYLWGGHKLKKYFHKYSDDLDIIAESWEVAANANGDCYVNYDYYYTLSELFENPEFREKYRESIFGTKTLKMEKFPLLIKLLDAHKDLSIQVHPDDEYAIKNENSIGKNECWYIVDCKPNSKIVCGLKKADKPLKEVFTSENIKNYLNYMEVNIGDLVYIPSGLVHALTSDILVLEVQQNSDVTYRIYDYDRVDKDGNKRELHIEKALEVVKPEIKTEKIVSNDNEYQVLLDKDCFKISKLVIDGVVNYKTDGTSFYTMTVISGDGDIVWGKDKCDIRKGKSFLIPATLGEFTLRGNMVVIKVEL